MFYPLSNRMTEKSSATIFLKLPLRLLSKPHPSCLETEVKYAPGMKPTPKKIELFVFYDWN